MLNQNSIITVENSMVGTQFVKPLYDSYCFSNIPGTVEYLLTGQSTAKLPSDVLGALPTQYDKVILFFLDAFGWKFFDKYKNKYPFLQHIVANGVASKITSQFPSTTAAHVTCINTGLSVGESGVYEWFYFEPSLDAIIAPLLFSFAGPKERETLKTAGADPHILYPTETIYKKLATSGITSYIYQSADYADSTYTHTVFDGATHLFGFRTLSEALVKINSDTKNEKGKAYFYFYFDKIDSIGHNYGPDSPEFEAEIDSFFTTLERLFYTPLKNNAGKTLFLMTADHGQANVDPATCFYLNKKIPEIKNWIKTSKKGELLVPAGSCRDMFLYIKEEHLDETVVKLQELLKGKSEVYKTEDLIKQGFFGTKVTQRFLDRVGNLVILSYNGESVWWYEEGKFEQRHRGHHGGLTKDEMETIFLALPL